MSFEETKARHKRERKKRDRERKRWKKYWDDLQSSERGRKKRSEDAKETDARAGHRARDETIRKRAERERRRQEKHERDQAKEEQARERQRQKDRDERDMKEKEDKEEKDDEERDKKRPKDEQEAKKDGDLKGWKIGAILKPEGDELAALEEEVVGHWNYLDSVFIPFFNIDSGSAIVLRATISSIAALKVQINGEHRIFKKGRWDKDAEAAQQ